MKIRTAKVSNVAQKKKVLNANPNDLSVTPRIHKVEAEN